MRYLFYLCMLLGISIGLLAQTTIEEAEYFFDSDPGQGNGTSLSITAGATITISNETIMNACNGVQDKFT